MTSDVADMTALSSVPDDRAGRGYRRRRSAGRRRRAALAAGAVLLGTALSGCLEVEMKLDVDESGTADLVVSMLVDTEVLAELAGAMGQEIPGFDQLTGEELLGELGQDGDPCAGLVDSTGTYETQAESVERGALKGVQCSVQDVPVSELTDLGDGAATSITQAGGITTARLTFADVDSMSGDMGDLESMGLPAMSFEEMFKISFVMTAPGGVARHNGTSVDGNTVTWVITPDAEFVEGGDAVMEAEWSTAIAGGGSGGGGSNTVLIIVIVAAALVVLAAVVLIARRRRSAPATAAVPGSMPATPDQAVMPTPGAPGTPPPPAAPGGAGTPLPPPPAPPAG